MIWFPCFNSIDFIFLGILHSNIGFLLVKLNDLENSALFLAKAKEYFQNEKRLRKRLNKLNNEIRMQRRIRDFEAKSAENDDMQRLIRRETIEDSMAKHLESDDFEGSLQFVLNLRDDSRESLIKINHGLSIDAKYHNYYIHGLLE